MQAGAGIHAWCWCVANLCKTIQIWLMEMESTLIKKDVPSQTSYDWYFVCLAFEDMSIPKWLMNVADWKTKPSENSETFPSRANRVIWCKSSFNTLFRLVFQMVFVILSLSDLDLVMKSLKITLIILLFEIKILADKNAV